MQKIGAPDHPRPGWLKPLFENLRSQMMWLDLFVGLLASATISLLLMGFRHQVIPEYKVGDIAREDVRASQDFTYEDPVATASQREAMRTGVPNLYELHSEIIRNREAEIRKLFDTGRELLSSGHAPVRGGVNGGLLKEVLAGLKEQSANALPENVLKILLKHRFNSDLGGRIIKVLDTVQLSGIVSNRTQFLRDQRAGIVLRDISTMSEQPLTESYSVRNLAAGRDYLHQFSLEFSELTAPERRDLLAYLETLLVPTIVFNATETDRRRAAAAAHVPPVEGQIKKGKTIVRSGDEINQNTLSHLAAMRKLQQPRSVLAQFLGFFLVVSTFVYALWRYFVYYQNRHRKIRNHTLLILLVFFAVVGVMRLLTSLADILSDRISIDVFRDPFNLYYAIPFVFGVILVTLLVDTNLGIFASLILSLLIGLYYQDVYIGVYSLIGSMAGIYSIRQYKDRAAILKAGLTVGAVNALGVVGLDLLRQSSFTHSLSVFKVWLALVSGILASALASMLLPALESLFKITTDIRLLELSNLNAPILRKLSVEAPGTYHHSLMVGTLAEAAAEAIGANPLLVRVGAYYHDLGKMLKPEYFVENQVFGSNKHETLSPSMSCMIIAGHVRDGLELAEEIGLAERIRDMIPQHHGTRIMTYFYQKAKDSIGAKNQEVVETDFRYPGPKPQTKEAAIMMMADSVEAASRTLSNPTPAQIRNMVDRLVDSIIADNQFDECDITFREIRLVKESFCKVLAGVFHRRIDYPGYDFKTVGSKTTEPAGQSTGLKQAKAFQDSSRRN